MRLQPPLLLPQARAPKRYDSALEARFARDMAKQAAHWRVVREPEPIDAGTHLAFPDFLLEHREQRDRRWWVEIVGFWTADYLSNKLATYRAARLPRVILCIDAKRTVAERDLPADAHVVRFEVDLGGRDPRDHRRGCLTLISLAPLAPPRPGPRSS